ncbi:MAG TPA: tripartite tricarboxylate transporter TctB family protein [Acetobacteraceae bacterium]|nr:tripartite tricarboxylate transporter TctB family protein [Acetobacteraceae bacterium]
MRINTKDVISGAIMLALALVGYWLNQDHALGSARRMGPGYMPMLTFWILGGIGATVLALGLFNGPDPLEKWTKRDIATPILAIVVGTIVYLVLRDVPALQQNMYALGIGTLVGCLVWAVSPGWKPLALVLAGMAVFALLLDKAGFMVAIVGTILTSVLADPTQRPKGVIGLVIFLLVLCYGVFIYYLDIRVNVWPQFN